jgi:hypothetical protein
MKQEKNAGIGHHKAWQIDYGKNISLVRFEVLTAVVMKSAMFWDMTPCSPLKVNQRFGETNRLQRQGGRSFTFHLFSRWFLARFLRP